MALSNVQLERILNKHRPKLFYHVFSYDSFDIHKCPYFPIAIVVNTHPKDRDGHWICMYIDRYKNGIFFDSTGIAPWGKFYDFLKIHTKKATFSTNCIQLKGHTCGHFCVFFVMKITKFKTLSNFLALFENKIPDLLVLQYYKFILARG